MRTSASSTILLSFTEETATVPTRDGKGLGARWTLPRGEVRGVAVLLPGSGNVGLEGDVSGVFVGSGYRGAPARLSEQLATALAGAGIATIRYAKRGYEDPSQLVNHTTDHLTCDAESAIEAARRRFPQAKLGLVGLSEGALVAVLAAIERRVDGLFLLGLPTRPIDEFLAYQFLEWPVELLRRMDTDRDGILSATELASLKDGKLPMLDEGFSGAPWQILDRDHDGALSVVGDVVPAYRELLAAIHGMLETLPLSNWYESFRALPPFEELARRVEAPVYLYQGLEDSQLRWSWVEADRRFFTGQTTLRLFPGVGHCFAPMDGERGEVKTSGPLSADVLAAVAGDVRAGLGQRVSE